MSVMTQAEVLGLPRGRTLTRNDLAAMPDDGHRYELLDGVLVVTPSPSPRHQRASAQMFRALDQVVSEPWELFFAPLDVVLAEDTVMQPDLLVAPRSAFTQRDLPVAPLLAVEVLSPSTRGIDLLLKKDRLQRSGCAHYWVVDPDEPSITAWQLDNGSYVQVAYATGDDIFEVAEPFPFNVAPANLNST